MPISTDEIKKFFKGDIENDEATLDKYSHDASLLEVRPQVVLFPKDSLDVQNLVKWVADKNKNLSSGDSPLSITPRSAGTDMSGAAIGESIILDFTRYMNKLIAFSPFHEPGEGRGEVYSQITVEPGMYYRDFEKITLEKGMILPCFTASKSINAMGGMYANNSAGERTLKYGKTEEYVMEAKVIFSDGNEYTVKPLSENELMKKIAQNDFEGNVYKNIYELIKENSDEIQNAKPQVHKNSAGYYIWNVVNPNNSSFFDLNKVLVGSQGTLGIATEITYKLVPDIKYSKLVAIFMNDLEPLGRLVDEILTLNPVTLESYDDRTMRLAVRFFPDFLKNKGLLGMIKFMWSFLPELGMMITGGFPKLILLVEFEGQNENDVHAQCVRLEERIKNFHLKVHITKNITEADKYWDIRRESFALLRKHVRGMRTAPFIDDIIVRPDFLPKFLPDLNNIFKDYKLIYTIAGHAGEGNFHIIPLMDFSRPDTGKIILELGERVYDLVARYHGSITAEHNDGLIRTPYLYKMYEPHILDIFKQIKTIFDPQNIFNPGKKVPDLRNANISDQMGTKSFIAAHLAQEHSASHKV